jgi:predicted Zn-dependent protease
MKPGVLQTTVSDTTAARREEVTGDGNGSVMRL